MWYTWYSQPRFKFRGILQGPTACGLHGMFLLCVGQGRGTSIGCEVIQHHVVGTWGNTSASIFIDILKKSLEAWMWSL